MDSGWTAYTPLGGGPSVSPGAGEPDPKPELADVGRLVRRGIRSVVRVARAGEGLTLASMLRDHLGVDGDELAAVEESWPPYEQVNVQSGVDAWLRQAGREHELVGVIGYQHRRRHPDGVPTTSTPRWTSCWTPATR